MQHIADWLENLGLGQYARCFTENDIDFAILGDLTDWDLEKIGVRNRSRRGCGPSDCSMTSGGGRHGVDRMPVHRKPEGGCHPGFAFVAVPAANICGHVSHRY